MIFKIILAFFGSAFPAILFNINRRKILLAGLSGALGWSVYLLVFSNGKNPIAASFAGAITVGIYSEAMARLLKTPAFGFLIPGIFPLVPGFSAYTTLRFIVENKLYDAVSKGIQTVAIGGSIGFGIMLSTAVFKFISKVKKGRKLPQ